MSINFFCICNLHILSSSYENNRTIAYPISGLFSQYLIDNHGLDKYKLLFTAQKGDNGFADVYELKLDALLADFYSWMDAI